MKYIYKLLGIHGFTYYRVNKRWGLISNPAEQHNSPEQMGYIKLDSDSLAKFLKAHPKYNKNGMLNLNSCSVRLQDELERTRKALEEAKNTLQRYNDNYDSVVAKETLNEIENIINQGSKK